MILTKGSKEPKSLTWFNKQVYFCKRDHFFSWIKIPNTHIYQTSRSIFIKFCPVVSEKTLKEITLKIGKKHGKMAITSRWLNRLTQKIDHK